MVGRVAGWGNQMSGPGSMRCGEGFNRSQRYENSANDRDGVRAQVSKGPRSINSSVLYNEGL